MTFEYFALEPFERLQLHNTPQAVAGTNCRAIRMHQKKAGDSNNNTYSRHFKRIGNRNI